MRNLRISSVLILTIVSALFLASCSGSGESNGSLTGIRLSPLIVAENVSVVDPQTPGGSGKPAAAGLKGLLIGITSADLPPASDYLADRTSVYVNERSMEAFKTINEILCMVHQSRYGEMLNQGPYKAQMDQNLCSTNRDSASGAGQASTNQTSGSTMPDYEIWTVDSYRQSSSSPHVVSAWVHQKQESPYDPTDLIEARIVITEGADTAPPYGLFKLDFIAYDTIAFDNITPITPPRETFRGFLLSERDATGKILLKFATEDPNFYYIQKATLDKNADGTGAGSSYTAENLNVTRFNIAYNNDFFLRNDGTTDVCLKRNPPEVSAWRYGLYTTTGQRVNVNSGFPIKKGSTYGWVGYWGLWMPDTVAVNDGDTVYKYDYITSTETPYTVRKAGGKLKKHTQKLLTLGDIKNVPLMWGDGSGTYFVAWTGSAFLKLSKLNTASNTWDTCGMSATCTPATIDLANLSWTELGFWTPSLSGYAIVKFPGPVDRSVTTASSPTNCGYNPSSPNIYDCTATATNTREVVLYVESPVFPGDPVPVTFACFDNCPDTATGVMSSPNPFHANMSYQNTQPALATYHQYALDTATMELEEGGTPVVESNPDPSFKWGITSGPLFDRTKVDLISGKTYIELLGCDWNMTGETCGSKAWSVLPEFYTWETGPNEWNQFVWVESGGIPVRFEPPLRVEYVHNEAGHKYDGTKFFLEYSGFGELQGIPGKCVNMDTGADIDCGANVTDPKVIRWVPEFTIPDINPSTLQFTEVTGGPGPTTFIVKALEKEERMKSVAPTTCTDPAPAGAGLSTQQYQLPSMSLWRDPSLRPEPATGPPRVIGGVVQ